MESNTDEDDCNDQNETDQRNDTEAEEDDEPAIESLGAAVDHLRNVVKEFKRKPVLMDEIRKVTSKDEFNGRALRPKLDCKTRWYSTFLMIERALEILPALNNVLSRHGTPIGAAHSATLEKIAATLGPLKKAILTLCRRDATLFHADKVFTLLLQDLLRVGTPLAGMLRENLLSEIKKRRTILSTLLAFLEDPLYDFHLEAIIGQRRPSNSEILELLSEIAATNPGSEAEPLEFYESATNKEPVTWDSIFSSFSTSANAESNSDTRSRLYIEQEVALFTTGGGRGRLLNRFRSVLLAIPPTSVEPERDFSALRLMIGENRANLSSATLDDLFVLRKAFKSGAF